MARQLERLSEVINTLATAVSDGDFLLTHMPFDNLYLYGKGARTYESAISEEQFYEEQLLNRLDEHKFVVIQGNHGCGKSHLIKWLYERYKKEYDESKDKIMFISRSRNTLQDAIEQILAADIFPDEIKQNELKRIKEVHKARTGEELSRQIVFEFTQAICRDEGKEDCVLEERYRNLLKVFLMDEYIQKRFLLLDKGPIEKIRAKLEHTAGNEVNLDDSPIFTELTFRMEASDIIKLKELKPADATVRFAEALNTRMDFEANRAKIEKYLNSKVREVITNSILYSSTDFRKVFQSLRRQLKKEGKRLTLFVEDITTLTGLDLALMEELAADHKEQSNADYCRITSFVGITQKVYDDNIPGNIKDRVTTDILIKEESILGEVEKLAQFAARYINAIYLSKIVVDKWVANGANYKNIPIAADYANVKWATVDVGEHKLSIYPFNKNALWTLYQAIDSDGRTPREFLKSVIKHILGRWFLLGKEAIFLDKKNFKNKEIEVPNWLDPKYESDNQDFNRDFEVQRGIVLRIWGDRTTIKKDNQVGGVDKAIFEDFDIDTDIFEQKDSAEKKPTIITSGTNVVDPVKSVQAKKSEYDLRYEELTNWFEKGGQLAAHIEFRDAIRQRIIDAIDWESEGITAQFVKAFFDSRYFVHIERQAVSEGQGYTIKCTRDAMFALMAVAAFLHKGNKSWDTGDSFDYINFMTWLEKNKTDIIAYVKDPKNAGVDVGYLNIASEYGCKLLTGQIKPSMTADEIYKAICDKIVPIADTNGHSDTWSETQKTIRQKCEQLHTNNLAYFSKKWGGFLEETTSYRFFDASEIYAQIEKLKKIDYDLSKITLNSSLPEGLLYGVPTYMISMIVKRLDTLINEERKIIDLNAFVLKAAIGNDYSNATIETAIDEMNGFLVYLHRDLEMLFSTQDFADLRGGKLSAPKIEILLNIITGLESKLTKQEQVSKLTELDMNFLISCGNVFSKFMKLLNEKRAGAQTAEGSGTSEIQGIRKKIKNDALDMKKMLEVE